MTDLMELASRVEAGEGPDRELDANILAAIAGTSNGPVSGAPSYTASRDAAMWLALDGWDHGSGIKGSGAWAYVHNRQPRFLGVGTRSNPDHVWIEAATVTEGRALTACWLRARAHQGTAHVEQ